ncbi:MAG: cytochrome c [Lysobacterales bacterium]
MRKGALWAGLIMGIILAALIGLFALPYIGVFDMTATGNKNILDWWGSTNLHSTIERNAPQTGRPNTAVVQEGFEHYANSCILCHGAPDVPRQAWADTMLPLPPELWQEDTQEMSDGELFYVVSYGIRMSGMPAFSDDHGPDDIWNIVAFLRHLDNLTEQQKQELRTAAASGHHDDDHEHGHHTEEPQSN